MNVNNNGYTFLFSSIMVIVVALLLSVSATSLKPFQDRNIELEKKQNLLKSIGIKVSREDAEKEYPNYIKEELVVNSIGEIQSGLSAFNIDLSKEIKKNIKEQNLPIYIADVEGDTKYIVPLRGKGLWGPIWGFISLKDDLNVVNGAIFDHKAETPGLGAEINTEEFQSQFVDKMIFKDSEFASILVTKYKASGDYEVDGISGGTITSDGVQDMLFERLEKYLPYFNKNIKDLEVEEMMSLFVDTTNASIDSLETQQFIEKEKKLENE